MPNAMLHLTINTGRLRELSRDEFTDDDITILRPFCQPGAYQLPNGPDWAVDVSLFDDVGFLFTVKHSKEPIVICGVAGDDVAADVLWPILECLYLELADQARRSAANLQPPIPPASTPWCAVAVVGPAAIHTAADWLSEFERCLAWAWLDR
jgi:hypothetical protein